MPTLSRAVLLTPFQGEEDAHTELCCSHPSVVQLCLGSCSQLQ